MPDRRVVPAPSSEQPDCRCDGNPSGGSCSYPDCTLPPPTTEELLSERPDIDRLADTVRTEGGFMHRISETWDEEAQEFLIDTKEDGSRKCPPDCEGCAARARRDAALDELVALARDTEAVDNWMSRAHYWNERAEAAAARVAELEAAVSYAEDKLRAYGTGVELIGARHRLRDALAGDGGGA